MNLLDQWLMTSDHTVFLFWTRKIEYCLNNKGARMSVYIIVENGEPYLAAFKTFASAAATVDGWYRKTIEEQKKESGGEPICSEIDLPEHVSGVTRLYVEKGINIIIYKVPLVG
jgi:hypothetical protein